MTGPDFVIPLSGAHRIELRALERRGGEPPAIGVEVHNGGKCEAVSWVRLDFAERVADAITHMVANLSAAPGFPNWTRPDAARGVDPSSMPEQMAKAEG